MENYPVQFNNKAVLAVLQIPVITGDNLIVSDGGVLYKPTEAGQTASSTSGEQLLSPSLHWQSCSAMCLRRKEKGRPSSHRGGRMERGAFFADSV